MSVDFFPPIEVFARPVAWALLHSLWQGALAATATVVLLALIPAKKARLRYAVCSTSLVLVFLAMCGSALYFSTAGSVPSPAPGDQQASAASTALPGSESATIQQAPEPATATAGSILRLSGATADWVVGFWLVGVVLFSLYHLLGWRKARGLVRRGTPEIPATLVNRAVQLCAELGITRQIRLLKSTLVCTPCVIGWLRPIVLMPASVVSNLSVQQLEMILAHELAHIRRYDVLVNYLQTAVETLLFFNPAAWWISRQVRTEREHCCDDLATAACGDHLCYAGALVRLEQLRGAMPSTALAADGTPLLNRIRRLTGMPIQKRRQAGAGLAGFLVLSAVIVFGAGCLGGFVSESAIADTEIITPGQYTPADDDIRGQWELDPWGSGFNIRLNFRSLGSNCSFTVDPEDLPSAKISAEDGFRVVRDAGTFYCVGKLDYNDEDMSGSGRCYFRMNPRYVEEMEEMGFRVTSPKRAFVLAIHNVTLAFTRGLGDAGYSGFPLDRLIELHIHDVTPEYINELSTLGYHDLDLDQLVAMQIHDVEPEYIRGLAELGYTDITASRLVEMQIHDVEIDYIEALAKLGYTDIPSAKLVELRIHDVDPYFIRELGKLGYDGISPSKLVEMKIHDVTPGFIKRQLEQGYRPSLSELVEMKIHGAVYRSLQSSSRGSERTYDRARTSYARARDRSSEKKYSCYVNGSTSSSGGKLKIVDATVYDDTRDWEFDGKRMVFDDDAPLGFRLYSPRGFVTLTLFDNGRELVYDIRRPQGAAEDADYEMKFSIDNKEQPFDDEQLRDFRRWLNKVYEIIDGTY